MRLLVVEDNEELAQLLAKGLKGVGFGADLVTTAAEARKVLTTTRYTALVLDPPAVLQCSKTGRGLFFEVTLSGKSIASN